MHSQMDGIRMPSVAKRILLFVAAVSMAALGMYLVGFGIGASSIAMQVGGVVALLVAVACLYFAAVDPWEDRG
jgi:branched-subunit amino acid transport protein